MFKQEMNLYKLTKDELIAYIINLEQERLHIEEDNDPFIYNPFDI